MSVELTVDPNRIDMLCDPENTDQMLYETGIFVRAKFPDGRFGSVDIEGLDRESLIAWLADDFDIHDGVSGRRAISTCLHLMGHKMLETEEGLPS